LLGPPRYSGKPVQSVSLEVELPAELCSRALNSRSSSSTSSTGGGAAVQALLDSVRVEVCGESFFVGAPACGELHVKLPFAVSQQVFTWICVARYLACSPTFHARSQQCMQHHGLDCSIPCLYCHRTDGRGLPA
jgi:hypothetical protein